MKKIFLLLLFVFIISCSNASFARDGQIDIDELIKRKEAERQSLEKISNTLNQLTSKDKGELTKKLNSFIRNEDDEIVKFDDSNDEINLQYFINIFNDNFLRNAVFNYLNKVASYINNTSEQVKTVEIQFPVIPIIISFFASLLICSLSTITGKEATFFPMVIKDAVPDYKSIDKKIDKLEEQKILPLKVKKYKPVNNNNTSSSIENSLEDSYGYNYDLWLSIGEQAVINLESFSNDQEFKNVYSHYHKNFVLSGHILEDAISESDVAEADLENINDKDNSLLSLLIKSRISNRFAGSELSGVNYMLTQTDLAYVSVFSDNKISDNSSQFWSENAWV